VAIDGGYGAWTNAGQPVIKPQPKQAALTTAPKP